MMLTVNGFYFFCTLYQLFCDNFVPDDCNHFCGRYDNNGEMSSGLTIIKVDSISGRYKLVGFLPG
jgi:hypothetical protein